MPVGQGNYRLDFTGGVNTTDCGSEAPGSMILCPTVGGPTGSWRGKGYSLRRVSDPRGPFNGFYWVSAATVTVDRVALINPTITPGVRMYPNRGSWYDENVRRGHPAAAFLAAVKAHEGYGKPGVRRSGHTQIIRDLVRGSQNPRAAIEPLFGPTDTVAARGLTNGCTRSTTPSTRRVTTRWVASGQAAPSPSGAKPPVPGSTPLASPFREDRQVR